jgi:hypothetical protein
LDYIWKFVIIEKNSKEKSHDTAGIPKDSKSHSAIEM